MNPSELPALPPDIATAVAKETAHCLLLFSDPPPDFTLPPSAEIHKPEQPFVLRELRDSNGKHLGTGPVAMLGAGLQVTAAVNNLKAGKLEKLFAQNLMQAAAVIAEKISRAIGSFPKFTMAVSAEWPDNPEFAGGWNMHEGQCVGLVFRLGLWVVPHGWEFAPPELPPFLAFERPECWRRIP